MSGIENPKMKDDDLDFSLEYNNFVQFHEIAKQLDIEYFLIKVAKSRAQGITYEEKKIFDIFDDSQEKYSVLSFKEGGWGFSYGYGNDLKKIKESFVKSAKLANWTSNLSKNKFKLYELKPLKDKYAESVKINLIDVDFGEKVEFVKIEAKKAESFDPRITNVNVGYSNHSGRLISYNSFDRYVERSSQSLKFSTVVYAKENSVMRNGFKTYSNKGGYELMENCRDLSIDAAKDAIELLNAKMITAGKANLIIDPLLSGTFVHEAFGHACEADAILANDSILQDKLGQKLAPEFVNITDGGATPGLNGSFKYDSELVESKDTFLIKDGILNSYLHSLETAGRMGQEPTGNGRAGCLFDKPIVRMSNTFLHPGSYTIEELLQELKNGYLFVNWKYGYTNPGDGMFMFKAEKAYKVENSEILKDKIFIESALTGNTLEVLQKISALSKETKRSPGTCGKNGQNAAVSDGGPYVLLKNMVVG